MRNEYEILSFYCKATVWKYPELRDDVIDIWETCCEEITRQGKMYSNMIINRRYDPVGMTLLRLRNLLDSYKEGRWTKNKTCKIKYGV